MGYIIIIIMTYVVNECLNVRKRHSNTLSIVIQNVIMYLDCPKLSAGDYFHDWFKQPKNNPNRRREGLAWDRLKNASSYILYQPINY